MNKDFINFLIGVGIAGIVILVLWVIGILGFAKDPSNKTMPGDGAIQKDSTFAVAAQMLIKTNLSTVK